MSSLINSNNNLQKKGTILFVHGFSSNASSHDQLRIALEEMGYSYHAMVFPGHSDDEYEEKSAMNLENYIDLTIKYIMENNLDNLILIGHSMGGAISVCVNELIPNRIKALILEDPLNKEIFSNPIKRLKDNMSNPIDFKNQDVSWIEKIKYTWNKSVKGKGDKSLLLLNLMNPLVINQISHAYEQLHDKPVLLMFGEYDRVIPPEESIEYIKSVANNVESHIIKDAKHSPSHDNFNEYWNYIKLFLEKLS